MKNHKLCMNCFQIKGDYQVCPFCGFAEGGQAKALFQLRPGTVLVNRYIIGEALGYGGFGITYKAYDTMLSIVVAIKEFYPSGLVNRADGETKVGVFSGSKSSEYHKLLERFIEEARNMAMFAEEKDIINVFAYFEENGTAYIIMEYVSDPILKKVLRRQGKMQAEEACGYTCSLLTAVQKLHNKGIIHRDISPDNIFLISSGQIKLFDFGAAKFQDGSSGQNYSVVVKPGYAPPEQYRRKGKQDHRMDIYAVGAVLYQMLTGERPAEALERMREDKLLSPSQTGCKVEPHVNKAVMQALALNPEERFSSADEFRQALLTPETHKKSWKWW